MLAHTQNYMVLEKKQPDTTDQDAKRRGPYKVFKEEVYALEQQGWATWQIARKMGIARRSVLRVLRERDAPMA